LAQAWAFARGSKMAATRVVVVRRELVVGRKIDVAAFEPRYPIWTVS